MSQPHTIPYTITYRAPCDGSTLFIAGTFSKPEWLLQEMQPSTPDGHFTTYSICVMVEPGTEYQYRFRHGRDGNWAVDEQKPMGKSNATSKKG